MALVLFANYQCPPNPVGWVDPLGLKCKEVKPNDLGKNENSWNSFQHRSAGVFKNTTQPSQGYQLWKDQDWPALEKLLGPGSWPPNRGFVYVKKSILKPGTRIDRFGGFNDPNGNSKDFGGFVSPEGSTFTGRALPADTKQKPYNAYEIASLVDVYEGPAIPWFGEKGMGTQYELADKKSIQSLKGKGAIKPVKPKYNPSDL